MAVSPHDRTKNASSTRATQIIQTGVYNNITTWGTLLGFAAIPSVTITLIAFIFFQNIFTRDNTIPSYFISDDKGVFASGESINNYVKAFTLNRKEVLTITEGEIKDGKEITYSFDMTKKQLEDYWSERIGSEGQEFNENGNYSGGFLVVMKRLSIFFFGLLGATMFLIWTFFKDKIAKTKDEINDEEWISGAKVISMEEYYNIQRANNVKGIVFSPVFEIRKEYLKPNDERIKAIQYRQQEMKDKGGDMTPDSIYIVEKEEGEQQ